MVMIQNHLLCNFLDCVVFIFILYLFLLFICVLQTCDVEIIEDGSMVLKHSYIYSNRKRLVIADFD